MPLENRDESYLWDMLKYARRVVILVGRTHFEAYKSDWALQMSMERAMEVIGEAARRITPGFRSAHAEIPWAQIVGQRNILAHEYGEIRCERIWETATVHVPELILSLEILLPDAATQFGEE
ncbi:MAG: DUF86 domain-containing protein [Candidatus Hydrogenedentes bacterium]|nr:DUF86 domain-containing protein [Candidatus Hydrogenedentota bacterium]